MTYPKFPQLNSRPTIAGTYPKDGLEELEKSYRLLTAVGLYVLPKRRNMKVPMADYWRKIDPVIMESVEQAMKEQSRVDNSGWCVATGSRSARAIVLDLDPSEIIRNGLSPEQVYNDIQAICETQFVLSTPAGGVHLYYRVSEEHTLTGNDAPPIKGVDFRGEGGQVVSLNGYNRYDDDYAKDKGVVNGHTDCYRLLSDGLYTFIPTANQELIDWLGTKKRLAAENKQAGEGYNKTAEGLERISTHNLRPKTEKEALTLECLAHVLRGWGGHVERDDWLQMWMSAHHSSDGSTVVRDYILGHPNIYWSDGSEGFAKFRTDWATHKTREDGYTVSSLFWLAKKAGWLTRTGYEIPDEVFERIDFERISEWIETLSDIPPYVLLQSQTGSGKTYAFAQLYNKLGRPKTVIIVPSIKLAIEMGNTLIREHKLPVTIYRDNDTLNQLEISQLQSADILVTTLQSFAVRLKPDMSEYGLLYIEESDQLLSQFARGGGGRRSSHVKENEARAGFEVLAAAFQRTKTVWMVDATMSRVSYEAAIALSPEAPRVFLNTRVQKKADCYFVDTREEAYQAVIDALQENKRVVVAIDTKNGVEQFFNNIREVLPKKKLLMINSTSARQRAVSEFMADVNEQAKKYDLVVYNSIMASGVSITGVTPDLVVQFASYLTPRNNLQLLNRYRKQKQVVVWYQERESLYADTDQSIYNNAFETAQLEAQMVRLPLIDRQSLAVLRGRLAALSQADEDAQKRSVKGFYQALLREDGRKVIDGEGDEASERLRKAMDKNKELRKQRADDIARMWPMIAPIDDARPANPDYDVFTVMLGEAHAEIEKVLRGNIPEGEKPEEVWNIVQEFKGSAYTLTAFINQEETLKRSEIALLDPSRAITNIQNNITLFNVLMCVRKLYYRLDETLDAQTFAIRAKDFMDTLTAMKEAYNKVVERRNEFDEVYVKNATDSERAKAFAKILLAKIGLKQRSERSSRKGDDAQYVYSIANLDNAYKFLGWRSQSDEEIDFSVTAIESSILSREDAHKEFVLMSAEQRDKVIAMVQNEKNTSFEIAVLAVKTGEF
jgi:RAD3-like DEAD/DEAH box helicase/bifunctional DNA primase/polymerase-like protein